MHKDTRNFKGSIGLPKILNIVSNEEKLTIMAEIKSDVHSKNSTKDDLEDNLTLYVESIGIDEVDLEPIDLDQELKFRLDVFLEGNIDQNAIDKAYDAWFDPK